MNGVVKQYLKPRISYQKQSIIFVIIRVRMNGGTSRPPLFVSVGIVGKNLKREDHLHRDFVASIVIICGKKRMR